VPSSPIDRLKQQKRALIEAYSRPDDTRALLQILATLLPLAGLWWLAVAAAPVSWWLTAAVGVVISLFIVRVFVLMHDCGHGSMFSTAWVNDLFGFLMGVLSGMPQYVWSQHHAHHHATNGNWSKCRGPLNIRSVDEYERMSDRQQFMYRQLRALWMAPIGGFIYLIFNPRFTWIKGTLQLGFHLLRGRRADSFETPYWASWKEYGHQTANNIVLLSIWALMCAWLGPAMFFAIYIPTLSFGGAIAILLFTVQHNFEHSYATGDEGWDYDTAAVLGTSFLVLPRWLHWITSNIAYHHVHHLSARIPNYRLEACHREYAELFADVRRLGIREMLKAPKYILWDTRAERIISLDEYDAELAAA
jgi:omega-6 fatty acid desaturase (delta-12 desaturase)